MLLNSLVNVADITDLKHVVSETVERFIFVVSA